MKRVELLIRAIPEENNWKPFFLQKLGELIDQKKPTFKYMPFSSPNDIRKILPSAILDYGC